jgi:hypothetical protein
LDQNTVVLRCLLRNGLLPIPVFHDATMIQPEDTAAPRSSGDLVKCTCSTTRSPSAIVRANLTVALRELCKDSHHEAFLDIVHMTSIGLGFEERPAYLCRQNNASDQLWSREGWVSNLQFLRALDTIDLVA